MSTLSESTHRPNLLFFKKLFKKKELKMEITVAPGVVKYIISGLYPGQELSVSAVDSEGRQSEKPATYTAPAAATPPATPAVG